MLMPRLSMVIPRRGFELPFHRAHLAPKGIISVSDTWILHRKAPNVRCFIDPCFPSVWSCLLRSENKWAQKKGAGKDRGPRFLQENATVHQGTRKIKVYIFFSLFHGVMDKPRFSLLWPSTGVSNPRSMIENGRMQQGTKSWSEVWPICGSPS